MFVPGSVPGTNPSKSLSAVLQSEKPDLIQDPLYTTDPRTRQMLFECRARIRSLQNQSKTYYVSSDLWEDFILQELLSPSSLDAKNLVQEARVRAELGPILGHIGKMATEGLGRVSRGEHEGRRAHFSAWK